MQAGDKTIPSHVAIVAGRPGGPVWTYSRYLSEAVGRLFPVKILTGLEDAGPTSLLHLQYAGGVFRNDSELVSPKMGGLYSLATVHTAEREPGARLEQYLILRRTFGGIIVSSPLAGDYFRAAAGGDVQFLPYGSRIFEPSPKEKARRALGLDPGTPTVFSLASSSEEIDLPRVTDAARRMKETRFVVHTMDGQDGTFLERVFARPKGLPANVTVVRERLSEDQIDLYASASDAFLLTTLRGEEVAYTSGPLHRLLAAGRPIVGSKNDPGLWEAEPGVVSVRYDDDAGESPDEALQAVLSDRDLAESLGAGAKKLSWETSWERVARMHIDSYGRLIGSFFGENWYDEAYYVGSGGGKEFEENGQQRHWSYFNPAGEWTGADAVMKAMKGVLKPANMLSIGEGRGTFVAYAADIGIDALGIDFSRWAVEHPYPRARGRLEWGDARDLSRFPDDSFDVVFASDLMEHIYVDDLDRVISEVQRVSRRWIFYNNGGTETGSIPPMFIKKGELPPKELHGTAIAGHVILMPCDWWKVKLVGERWKLRDDLVGDFRGLVGRVDPAILGNWRCVIITEKVPV